jgi:membrane-associated phospholipid phosphatase
MQWLVDLDIALFRWINLKLVNPVFDWLMPILSGNSLFFPMLVVGGVLLVWKGRHRGFVCLVMMAVVVGVGDGFISRTMKQAVGRPRPFVVLEDVRVFGKMRNPSTDSMGAVPGTEMAARPAAAKGPNNSMPSSHAANWFSATMVALIYYRRSLWFMLSLAFLVGFSRIYNGVHYPSDVLAGAILGAGYGGAIVWLLDSLWEAIGRRFFPLWWAKFPSLLNPVAPRSEDESGEELTPPPKVRGRPGPDFQAPHITSDLQWFRLGCALLFVLLVAKLIYIASGTIQLSEDEAYQWVWSKHLDISYFSKPPFIAYAQFIGTSLWGDTAFGVRFLSPVLATILGFLLLRFFHREVNARAGFFLLLILAATPLTAAGSVLMTVDPLSVLFWTAAMIAGWKAMQDSSGLREWFWVGLWMGCSFLSKYTGLAQLVCWIVFFALWPPARKHLRRPGPYVALLVNLVCMIPVIVWNAQRKWVTVGHVADNARFGSKWQPTLQYLGEFLASELGLLNPVFFVAMIWACVAFWKRHRNNPRMIYFFSMGAPLFLGYLLFTGYSRVLPNWIAPSVIPLFCLMVLYWDTQWRLGTPHLKRWLLTGLAIGTVMVVFGFNTDLVSKFTGGRYLPVSFDPLHRVREWDKTAELVGQVRSELLVEGKPVFIITGHYGMAGQVSFYLPEARTNVTRVPVVYFRSSPTPLNQFFFWPGYKERKGENAIYVRELGRANTQLRPPPPLLLEEFETVTDLGSREVLYHKQVIRRFQFFACRNLK